MTAQCRESRIVEAEAHAQPHDHPAHQIDYLRVRVRQDNETCCEQKRACGEKVPATPLRDRLAHPRRDGAGDQKREREASQDPRFGPGSLRRNWLSKRTEQVVGTAPAKNLGYT